MTKIGKTLKSKGDAIIDKVKSSGDDIIKKVKSSFGDIADAFSPKVALPDGGSINAKHVLGDTPEVPLLKSAQNDIIPDKNVIKAVDSEDYLDNVVGGSKGARGPKTGKYGDLVKDTSLPGQAHHINQNAAYKDVIPKNEGMSVKLEGNAFTQPGTPHYEVHNQMETFWNQYRRGGSRAATGTMPSNLEYSNAMLKALKESGLSKTQAMQVIKESVNERIEYGLLGGMEVPRLPGRINQVGR